MDDKAKDKVRRIMKVEAMSSEESCSSLSEDDHDFKRKFIPHPLDWRSKEADELLTSLDRKHGRRQSAAAKAMTSLKVTGKLSERRMPVGILPEWAVSHDHEDSF